MTSTSTSIPRATACQINPLIGSVFSSDTLESVARITSDLGYLLCQINSHRNGAEPCIGSLYLICDCISAAVRYEIENPVYPK